MGYSSDLIFKIVLSAISRLYIHYRLFHWLDEVLRLLMIRVKMILKIGL